MRGVGHDGQTVCGGKGKERRVELSRSTWRSHKKVHCIDDTVLWGSMALRLGISRERCIDDTVLWGSMALRWGISRCIA